MTMSCGGIIAHDLAPLKATIESMLLCETRCCSNSHKLW